MIPHNLSIYANIVTTTIVNICKRESGNYSLLKGSRTYCKKKSAWGQICSVDLLKGVFSPLLQSFGLSFLSNFERIHLFLMTQRKGTVA